MEKVMTVDEKYNGKYIALKGCDDATVVGAGKKPEQALSQAKKGGHAKPYIMYIPENKKGVIYQ